MNGYRGHIADDDDRFRVGIFAAIAAPVLAFSAGWLLGIWQSMRW